MNKKLTYTFLLLCSTVFAFGQVGINTSAPSGIFHVDAAKNNNNTAPSAANILDDVVISSTLGKEGYVGLGNTNPAVKLDVRSTSSNGSAVGIGFTSQTADAAGAGALRFNASTSPKRLECSNGTNWIPLQNATITPKAVVTANKSNAANITNRQSYYFGWNKVYDPANLFTAGSDGQGEANPTGGFFTAPRTGTYLAVFTFAANTNVNALPADNNQIEAIWEVRDTGTGLPVRNRLKCANNFPANSLSSTNTLSSILVGSNCAVSVYMTAGQRLYPFVWVDLNPGGVTLSTNSTYNTLTIVEQ